ncbi:MAG TPA: hypothetical protein VK699_14615 [Terriglobales bacterium]|nr:hypothetical protein [Terriglobales bacterium]
MSKEGVVLFIGTTSFVVVVGLVTWLGRRGFFQLAQLTDPLLDHD